MPKVQYRARVEMSGTDEEIRNFIDNVLEKAIEDRFKKTKKIELFYESEIVSLEFGFKGYGKDNKKDNESPRTKGKELQNL